MRSSSFLFVFSLVLALSGFQAQALPLYRRDGVALVDADDLVARNPTGKKGKAGGATTEPSTSSAQAATTEPSTSSAQAGTSSAGAPQTARTRRSRVTSIFRKKTKEIQVDPFLATASGSGSSSVQQAQGATAGKSSKAGKAAPAPPPPPHRRLTGTTLVDHDRGAPTPPQPNTSPPGVGVALVMNKNPQGDDPARYTGGADAPQPVPQTDPQVVTIQPVLAPGPSVRTDGGATQPLVGARVTGGSSQG